jgi:two-component system sensor histidine kinase UhpB
MGLNHHFRGVAARACLRCPVVKLVRYIREPRRLPLVWRAGLANASVLGLLFLLFVVTPVTVHAPIHLTEALILAAGLGVLLVVNLALLRRALSPLDELAAQMSKVDLRDPRPRLSASAAYGPVLSEFVETFNVMLVRLAEERRKGALAALTAQERERLRVAHALHDEAGQTLTAIALEIERAAADGPVEQRGRMAALAKQLHASLDEIRRISRDLRPEALDDLGLVNALIALTRRIDRQGELAIERRLAARLPELTTDQELVIYRVAQEALTNVLRHAEASRCVVELEASGETIELSVSDDGVGIPSETREGTIGIEGMRERALLVGGTLSIDSAPGRGTRVVLRLPIGRPA